ncbi:MAG TPA: hypothetical protein VMU25_01275 [Candidatus Paceibacterota bacterium]|nr:hypothetical protein [Candidatus Paceibacterota bacterium]
MEEEAKDPSKEITPIDGVILTDKEKAVLEQITGGNWKKYGRVAMAALGGLPWVGSVLSAAATLSSENEQGKTNHLLFLWVQEHEEKLRNLVEDLKRIFARLETFGDSIEERIRSVEYIDLMRKTFRVWDASDTEEKREKLRKLITSAAATQIVSDDIVRLFIELIGRFHELHFRIIREVYLNPGITKYELAEILFGTIPRDDSAQADLFKFLMHELNMADIVRGERETDFSGRFVRRTRPKKTPGSTPSTTYDSPFDTKKGQVLTELGKQFVHYAERDLDAQLEATAQ